MAIDVHLRKLERCELNVTVHVTKEFRFRRWLAMQLFRMAGRVLGANVKVQ